MPAADLGAENPLPQLAMNRDLHAASGSGTVPFGQVSGCLPYAGQDGYNRVKRPRDFQSAVLENDWLRAEFLLEAGGRLWSLVHKPSGRELLHVNPVFQPANLAIRNAWISGGVEWNCGIIGHTPFTVAPLFAARLEWEGMPVLRMWEWERVRQAVFQIDVFLPEGSPVLFVRPRIVNTRAVEIAMYWWSNIAVDEEPGRRVVVPADSAAHFGYTDGVKDTPVPVWEGVDVTYSTNLKRAQDFFYNLPDAARKYIAAPDARGVGLVQTSTDRLRGRKLFVWGRGPGGRRWQEFLAAPGCAYLEIQAGLARTQMDYLRLPPRGDWSWLEAYGCLEADPGRVHGDDWAAARGEVEAGLDRLVTRSALDEWHRRTAVMADQPPGEIIRRGSGWGALEQVRRRCAGEAPLCGPQVIFDEASLGTEQADWRALLETGRWPDRSPVEAPGSFMVQPEWRAWVEKRLSEGDRDWRLAWHAGVMRYYAGEIEAAVAAWEDSFRAAPNVWALRNLAVAARALQREAEAGDRYAQACRMAPHLAPLAIEAGQFWVETGRARTWLEVGAGLAPEVQAHPRVGLLRARALLETGDLAAVDRYLTTGAMSPDIREGEVSLSDLWFGLQERRRAAAENRPVDEELKRRVRRECPPPADIDFRMNTEV